jgi:hypothetical protein
MALPRKDLLQLGVASGQVDGSRQYTQTSRREELNTSILVAVCFFVGEQVTGGRAGVPSF